MTRVSWDEIWLAQAHGIARRSLCSRDQVGAVIVSEDNTPLMASYNGPPAGFTHEEKPCTEWCPRARGDNYTWEWPTASYVSKDVAAGRDMEGFYVVRGGLKHYLVTDDDYEKWGFVKKPVLSSNYEDCPALHAEANALSRSNHMHRAGGTIYVTSDVCYSCAKLIANSGIKRVVVDQTVPREYRNSAKSYEFLTIACGLTVTLVTEHHELPADYWETAE